MCFVLYAGTTTPIPRSAFDENAPYVHVTALTEDEMPVSAHFSAPAVQNIGSTSGCGCDFPHAMFQNGGWPEIDFAQSDNRNPERAATHSQNLAALAALLQSTGETTIELYGVWWSDMAEEPQAREVIAVSQLLDPAFRLKERGFYTITL